MEVLKPPNNKSCLEFLSQILFIYKKIEEGWTVKKSENDTFEFTKPINQNQNETVSFDLFNKK